MSDLADTTVVEQKILEELKLIEQTQNAIMHIKIHPKMPFDFIGKLQKFRSHKLEQMIQTYGIQIMKFQNIFIS